MPAYPLAVAQVNVLVDAAVEVGLSLDEWGSVEQGPKTVHTEEWKTLSHRDLGRVVERLREE